ncbi:DNA polymerase III subunit delta [Bacillus sp. FSL W7-1360]
MKLLKKMRQTGPEPIYLLHGTETFLVEQFLQAVREVLFQDEDSSMNEVSLRLADMPLHEVIEEARTLPFFAEKKLVIVHDFYIVTSQKVTTPFEHDVSVFEAYMSSPTPGVTLVLIAPYEKLDDRKKITKCLKKGAALENVNPLSEQGVHAWIQQQLQTQDMEIEAEAISQLFRRVGTNLTLLDQELKKCALYVCESGTITSGTVAELVAETVEQSVFTLVEHVVNGRTGEAVALYAQLLKQKEEPLVILTLLARQFRIFFQVKIRLSQGYTQKDIASQLKLHPYVVKLAIPHAKSMSREVGAKALTLIADTDYAIKTGKQEKRIAVEWVLLQLGEVQAVKV